MKIVKKFPEKAEFLAENNKMKIRHTLRYVYVLWKDSDTIIAYSVKDYFKFTTDLTAILFAMIMKNTGFDELINYII